MPEISKKVQEQYRQLLAAGNGLPRAECARRFPDLIAYIREHTSLIDLMRDRGIKIKPLSLDAPGVYIAEDACPCCGGNLTVKE